MITTSIKKPAKIEIIEIRDDKESGKTFVQYVMYFNVQEETTEQKLVDLTTDELIVETIPIYKYFEYPSSITVSLAQKSAIPEMLKALYKHLEPIIFERLSLPNSSLSKIDIPRKIDWED